MAHQYPLHYLAVGVVPVLSRKWAWLGMSAHAEQAVPVSCRTRLCRSVQLSRSLLSRNILRRSRPLNMMWWWVPGASIIALRGMKPVYQKCWATDTYNFTCVLHYPLLYFRGKTKWQSYSSGLCPIVLLDIKRRYAMQLPAPSSKLVELWIRTSQTWWCRKKSKNTCIVISSEDGIQYFQTVTDHMDSGFHLSNDFLRESQTCLL